MVWPSWPWGLTKRGRLTVVFSGKNVDKKIQRGLVTYPWKIENMTEIQAVISESIELVRFWHSFRFYGFCWCRLMFNA